MTDEKLETRAVVERQLIELKAEHLHHLLRALGMAHPDLATVAMHDAEIKRLDMALGYLKHYPKGGYGLDDEDAKSPKVWAWMQRNAAKLLRLPPPEEPAEEV